MSHHVTTENLTPVELPRISVDMLRRYFDAIEPPGADVAAPLIIEACQWLEHQFAIAIRPRKIRATFLHPAHEIHGRSIYPPHTLLLRLPVGPVKAVTSVTIDGQSRSDFMVNRHIIHLAPRPLPVAASSPPPSPLAIIAAAPDPCQQAIVEFVAGYGDPIPHGVLYSVAMLAQHWIQSPPPPPTPEEPIVDREVGTFQHTISQCLVHHARKKLGVACQ